MKCVKCGHESDAHQIYKRSRKMRCVYCYGVAAFHDYGGGLTWRTAEGKRIPIEELGDRHLKNILARFGEEVAATGQSNKSNWRALIDEQARRDKLALEESIKNGSAMTDASPEMKPRKDKDDAWINRTEIRSESTDTIYIVAQHKRLGFWGCSCMGWRNRRYCKHLAAAGITEKNRTSEGEASLRGSPDE